jgi:single-strand DNA-binding protein
MNKVNLIGRLTKDVEARYSQGDNPMCVARFTLAVDKKYRQDGQATADFINIVAFGKSGEFAEKYFRKGMKVAVSGRIQTGSYTNKDNVKVYTTDIVAEELEFCESKGDSQPEPAPDNGFMSIPDGLENDLPFK